MDLERERTHLHLGFFVRAQRALGLWTSWEWSYVLVHLQHRGNISLFLYAALRYGNGRDYHGDQCDVDTHAHSGRHDESRYVRHKYFCYP